MNIWIMDTYLCLGERRGWIMDINLCLRERRGWTMDMYRSTVMDMVRYTDITIIVYKGNK